MTERGCTVAGCEGPHLARGYCRAHYVRWQRHGDPQAGLPVLGRTCGQVSYWSAHQRVRTGRGPATAQRCADCGGAAVVWSYDGTDPEERTDPARDRRYSADPGRYRPRCRSCHRRGALPSLDVEHAARLYRAGASARGIGALLRVSQATVLRALRAHGVAIRTGGRPSTRT